MDQRRRVDAPDQANEHVVKDIRLGLVKPIDISQEQVRDLP